MTRTPQQQSHRAAVADASVGDGHEPPELYLYVPLTMPAPCEACGVLSERGVDHGCTGRRPEAAQ